MEFFGALHNFISTSHVDDVETIDAVNDTILEDSVVLHADSDLSHVDWTRYKFRPIESSLPQLPIRVRSELYVMLD